MRRIVIFLVFAAMAVQVYSQDEIVDYTPDIWSENGHSYISEDADYLSAEKEFAKIHKSDSLYIEALHNRVVCNRHAGNFRKAIELADKGLELNKEYLPGLYINKALCLDSLGKFEDAIKLIEAAEERFPYNYTLKLTKGSIYESNEEYKKAINIFQQCVLDEPLNHQNHLNLADAYMKGNGITHVVLPVAVAILISPENESNLSLLRTIEALVSSKYYSTSPNYDIYKEEGDFRDIDELVTNYIALSDDYKVPSKISYGLIKQLHLILSETDSNQDDFITEVYINKLKPYLDKDFDLLAGLLSFASTNDAHVKFIDKNMDKLIDLNSSILEEFRETSVPRASYPNIKNAGFIYSDAGKVQGIGEMNKSNSDFIGPVVYFNDIGSVSAIGQYDSKGDQTGEWKWYNSNGDLFRRSTFIKGKLEGVTEIYNDEDGGLLKSLNFANDELNGQSDYYKLIGYKYQTNNYKDGQFDGIETGYSPDGSISYKYNYKQGLIEGAAESYYDDGTLFYKGSYKEGLLEGEVVGYYRDGQTKYIENYSKGELDGSYKYYHINGQLSNQGQFKNGNRSGAWTEYNILGRVITEDEYDSKGKKNGVTKVYNTSGILENEYYMEKGIIKKIINYNQNGGVLSIYEQQKNGEFDFEICRANGSKASEGKLLNGKKNGKFMYYNIYGGLNSVESYENDTLTGKVLSYFLHGGISNKVEYTKGKKSGTEIEYFSSGSPHIQSTYRNGDLHGLQVTYNHDGTKYRQKFYYNGELHGECVYYNPNNVPYSIEEYKYGYMVSVSHLDSIGQVTNQTTFEQGKGVANYDFSLGGEPMGLITYEGGDLNGPQKRFYRNGDIRREYSYKRDMPHGKNLVYHHDGYVISESNYNYGLKEGAWKEYRFNGDLYYECNYKDDLLHGKYINYYPTGEVLYSVDYEYGELKNHYKSYSVDGSVAHITYVDDGLLTGFTYLKDDGTESELIKIVKGNVHVETYYQNGLKSMDCHYKNGVLEGDYIMNYQDGTVYQKETYKNGYYHGLQEAFYPDGTIYSEKNFEHGIQQGSQKYYYPNGKLKLSINYHGDEKHGPSYEYDKNGNLVRKLNYYGNVLYDKL